jgi:hypothetical protein
MLYYGLTKRLRKAFILPASGIKVDGGVQYVHMAQNEGSGVRGKVHDAGKPA